MTTYTFDAIHIIEEDTPADSDPVIGVSPSALTIVAPGNDTTFEWDNVSGTLTEDGIVSFSSPLYHVTLDGIDVSLADIEIATITWDDGGTIKTTSIAIIHENIDVYLNYTFFVLDGDALPSILTPQDAEDWFATFTSASAIVGGVFGPNTPIDFDSIQALDTQTENDIITTSGGMML